MVSRILSRSLTEATLSLLDVNDDGLSELSGSSAAQKLFRPPL